MRRLTLLVFLAIAITGCASTTSETSTAVGRSDASAVSEIEEATATASSTTADPTASTTTTSEQIDQPAPLLSGRDAIAEAQGKPHVLWFWGAH